ncbi:MAG: hypothetical protein KDB03_18490 [Planctomycetales bacterium]|nr:hypothetical protein [Planctomycetales bacterium]
MDKIRQNASLINSSKVAPNPSPQHNKLVEASTEMIIGATGNSGLLSLFNSKTEKARRAKLKVAMLEESARVADTQLKEAQELLRLGTTMAEQQYIDALRVEYQDTVGSMARQAENDLRDGVINLYSAKVGILESLASLDADSELKDIAANVLSRLTEASVEQLIRNNTKPR